MTSLKLVLDFNYRFVRGVPIQINLSTTMNGNVTLYLGVKLNKKLLIEYKYENYRSAHKLGVRTHSRLLDHLL